mmetsp:Transcript_9552/g.11540  ORF Transcript_9552/g.11540 Transcript_9552/m.11540 type:complete len:814 (+) Transcript_9552:69-2510(+)
MKTKILICANCGSTESVKPCAACGVVYYCKKTCQIEHWKQEEDSHRLLCARTYPFRPKEELEKEIESKQQRPQDKSSTVQDKLSSPDDVLVQVTESSNETLKQNNNNNLDKVRVTEANMEENDNNNNNNSNEDKSNQQLCDETRNPPTKDLQRDDSMPNMVDDNTFEKNAEYTFWLVATMLVLEMDEMRETTEAHFLTKWFIKMNKAQNLESYLDVSTSMEDEDDTCKPLWGTRRNADLVRGCMIKEQMTHFPVNVTCIMKNELPGSQQICGPNWVRLLDQSPDSDTGYLVLNVQIGFTVTVFTPFRLKAFPYDRHMLPFTLNLRGKKWNLPQKIPYWIPDKIYHEGMSNPVKIFYSEDKCQFNANLSYTDPQSEFCHLAPNIILQNSNDALDKVIRKNNKNEIIYEEAPIQITGRTYYKPKYVEIHQIYTLLNDDHKDGKTLPKIAIFNGIDKDGNKIQKLDKDGNQMYENLYEVDKLDEGEKIPIFMKDQDGNKIQKLDKDGNKLYEKLYEYYKFDESGEKIPIFDIDKDGNQIQKLDKNGNQMYEKHIFEKENKKFYLVEKVELIEKKGNNIIKSYKQKYTGLPMLCLRIERDPKYIILTIALPMCAIVMLCMASFLLDFNNGNDRLQAVLISVLVISAFKTSIEERLPNKSYLTYADYYMLACFLFHFILVAKIVFFYQCLGNGVGFFMFDDSEDETNSNHNIDNDDTTCSGIECQYEEDASSSSSSSYFSTQNADDLTTWLLILLWIIPHIILFFDVFKRKRMTLESISDPQPSHLEKILRPSWGLVDNIASKKITLNATVKKLKEFS